MATKASARAGLQMALTLVLTASCGVDDVNFGGTSDAPDAALSSDAATSSGTGSASDASTSLGNSSPGNMKSSGGAGDSGGSKMNSSASGDQASVDAGAPPLKDASAKGPANTEPLLDASSPSGNPELLADACSDPPCSAAPEVADAGKPLLPQCSGCLIDDRCVGEGQPNPANPCQICEPESAIDDWSSDDGAACDDGLFCTLADLCEGGLCVGMERPCDDDVACNGVSTCNEKANKCSAGDNQCSGMLLCDVESGDCVTTCDGCLVEGVCLVDGAQPAGNPCLICDSARSPVEFSSNEGVDCGTGAISCSQQDTCDANGACVANHDASGASCGPSPSGECDAQNACDGNGACRSLYASEGASCGGSPSGSCDAPDTCDGTGRCIARYAAAGEACGEPASGECDAQDICNGSGTCLAEVLANGASCEDGQFCTDADTCESGVCVAGEARDCGDGQDCHEDVDRCAIRLLPDGDACTDRLECDSGQCVEWFEDLDEDGFGSSQAVFTCGTSAPAGYTSVAGDCCDKAGSLKSVAASIHPDQTEFFEDAQAACNDIGSHDYDCDGQLTSIFVEGPVASISGACDNVLLSECDDTTVWLQQPDCGTEGTALRCSLYTSDDGPFCYALSPSPTGNKVISSCR